MYLIKNHLKKIKLIPSIQHDSEETSIFIFNTKHEISGIDDINITIRQNKVNKQICVQVLMTTSRIYDKKTKSEKEKLLFNLFSGKEYIDYFFKVPITSELGDQSSSIYDFVVVLYGIPKFNVQKEFNYLKLLSYIPEIEKLKNEKTLSFINENINRISSYKQNSEYSKIESLSKMFDINSDDFFYALSLEYEY